MTTMRERLRSIAFELRQIDMGVEADELDALATRLESELADTQGDASSLAWHIQRVLLRLDAPVEP